MLNILLYGSFDFFVLQPPAFGCALILVDDLILNDFDFSSVAYLPFPLAVFLLTFFLPN